MKKGFIIGAVLFFGLSFPVFAKAGVANGGFLLMLAIIGFLLLVAGLFAGIEYLMRNGGDHFNHFKSFLKRRIIAHKKSV